MVFTLLKLNDDFMIKTEHFKALAKMTIPQPFMATPKPLEIASGGITLIF